MCASPFSAFCRQISLRMDLKYRIKIKWAGIIYKLLARFSINCYKKNNAVC